MKRFIWVVIGAGVFVTAVILLSGYLYDSNISRLSPSDHQLAQVAGSRTFYIDYQNGSDSNSGLSKSSPWKRQPYMNGFSGNYSHQAGDRFIFRGGVTWPSSTLTWIIRSGGSYGNPDYYGVDQSWYAGSSWSRPVIDGESRISNFVFFGTLSPYSASAGNIVFDNFDLRNLYWSGTKSYGQVWFITAADGTLNITIQNCYIHDWTHGSFASGTNDKMYAILGESISPYNQSWVIDNVTIDGGAANSSDFNSSGWGIGPFGGKITNSTIKNAVSLIMASVGTDIGYNDLGPSWNSFDYNAHDNIMNMIFGGAHYIHDNYIHDGKSETLLMGSNQGETDYIWNNVFYNNTQAPLIDINGVYAARVYLWNNTFDALPSGTIRVHSWAYGPPNSPLGVLEMKNNLFIYDGSLIDQQTGINSLVDDGNTKISRSQASTLGLTASNNYRPSASSPTIGAGRDLSSNLNGVLTKDIIGLARPQSGRWDSSAYQYAGSAVPIQQPTTYTVSVSKSGTGSGTVSGSNINCGSTCSTSLNAGTSVTFTASASSGSSFAGWGGSCSGNSATCTITINSNTSVSASFSQNVVVPPPVTTIPTMSSLSFNATAGLITAPFVSANSQVSQGVQTTDPSQSGQAAYKFNISQAGNYLISMNVNAPSDANNSLFVSVDNTPTTNDVWYIPAASGFIQRTVTSGSDTSGLNNSNKVFSFSAGTHTLYIYGREANTYISTISIAQQIITPPPTYSLSISKSGNGAGTVTSSGGSINCGSTCSVSGLSSGQVVSLSASASSGSSFAGWGGSCSGNSATCTITINSNTSVSASFSQNVVVPPPDTTPPTITSVTASAITKNTATISWSTNESADTQVEYGLTSAFGSNTALVSSLITTHSQNLSNLLPNTTYYYRVRSKDAAGNLSISGTQSFITLVAPPQRLNKPPGILNLKATKGSIILSWDNPTDYSFWRYTVIYKSSSPFNQTSIPSDTLKVASTTADNYHDTDVTAGSVYYYVLYAVDDQGNYSDGAYVSFTAPQDDTTPTTNPPTTGGGSSGGGSSSSGGGGSSSGGGSSGGGGGGSVSNSSSNSSGGGGSVSYSSGGGSSSYSGGGSSIIGSSNTSGSVGGGQTNSVSVARTTTNLNMRSSPTTKGPIVQKAPTGTAVTILSSNLVTQDGYNWANIKLADGTTGWMAVEYLTTPIVTQEVNTAVSLGGASLNTSTQNGTVNANVNFRTSPSISGQKISVLLQGTGITITGQSTYKDGYYWLPITTSSGVSGFVASPYITAVNVQSPANTSSPTNQLPTPKFNTSDKVTSTTLLNIRSLPSTASTVLTKLSPGSYVTVAGRDAVFAGGYNWYQIQFGNGTLGWAAGEYLKK